MTEPALGYEQGEFPVSGETEFKLREFFRLARRYASLGEGMQMQLQAWAETGFHPGCNEPSQATKHWMSLRLGSQAHRLADLLGLPVGEVRWALNQE